MLYFLAKKYYDTLAPYVAIFCLINRVLLVLEMDKVPRPIFIGTKKRREKVMQKREKLVMKLIGILTVNCQAIAFNKNI